MGFGWKETGTEIEVLQRRFKAKKSCFSFSDISYSGLIYLKRSLILKKRDKKSKIQIP
jgi:hypothetical protein